MLRHVGRLARASGSRWCANEAGLVALRRGAANVAGNAQSMHQPLGVPPSGTDRDEVRAKWQSNAMDMINEVPPIMVAGRVAVCDGGGGPLGHPVEYIKLDTPYPSVCKYCGLRYVSSGPKAVPTN